MTSAVERVTSGLDSLVRFLVAACMGLMVLVVSWQVLSRYILGDPAAWTEEVALTLLIWVGLLGGVYAYREKAHLGLDLLEHRLGPLGKHRIHMFSDLCCGVFALAVLVVGGGALVQLTYQLEQTTAALGVPMAYVYAVLPLSGLLIVYYSIVSLFTKSQEADV
ncbi:TRAP transporter small permease [Arenicella xantha]|uniref:TRAP transporter small permease protein n=1 Tax=Arenicella xantha TaxID=644221 RepID=A0A395JMZ0_9GAMM|nr:TRAP transporter small permease [Arenicella xantha]RBP53010.1 TRAP-type C4-dicarboxylate transport system permease small subunit [Arenicella xantha]